MFVSPIITQKNFDRFASNLDWGTRENHRNFLGFVLRFQVEWIDFYGKIDKIISYDKVQVNGGITYEYRGQCWVGS